MARATRETDAAWPPTVPHEESEDHTAYWTLSLYIDADKIFGPAGSDALFAGKTYRAEIMARLQTGGAVSRALRDAIEPLFNDIADREWLEGAHDFLFAAGAGDDAIGADPAGARHRAAECARASKRLSIHLPSEIRWTTEGIHFVSRPRDLNRRRQIKLRRFWFVHNNGAISYNLSFTIPYVPGAGDFYFLSVLQKLAAPKEFALGDAMREAGVRASPLQPHPLGIGPLDEVELCACPAAGCVRGCKATRRRFWPMIAEQFAEDAPAFFNRIAGAFGEEPPDEARLTLETMVGLTPIIEVPGLYMPKNRYMFLIRDEGFFSRLIPPVNPASGERYPRKMMIQDRCFKPFSEQIKLRTRQGGLEVRLDHMGRDAFWRWVEKRPDQPGHHALSDADIAAIRSGEMKDEAGNPLHIPAFERGRTDCLDYLFLSGFNQNIIDFMNQDTSEILDSLDPIYPKTDDQLDERFFVRFANHRGMITYVPRSRSLEVGNDYIGTCPYAFLIHALAMHNEFLARRQEYRSFSAIMQIEAEVDAKRREEAAGTEPERERTEPLASYQDIGIRINDIKVEYSRDYERYRHANIFRYDTERDVFEELEKLRGTDRKQQALQRTIANLEDHARDLDVLQQRADGERQEVRDRSLSAVLALLGLFGFVQVLFGLGDYFEDHSEPAIHGPLARAIAHAAGPAIGNLAWLLATIGVVALLILAGPLLLWTLRNWRTIGRFFGELPRQLSRSIDRRDMRGGG